MTEMEERVARAIEGAGEKAGGLFFDLSDEDLLTVARAAMEAMREPTRAMIDAGMAHCGVDLETEYKAMVGAALGEDRTGRP